MKIGFSFCSALMQPKTVGIQDAPRSAEVSRPFAVQGSRSRTPDDETQRRAMDQVIQALEVGHGQAAATALREVCAPEVKLGVETLEPYLVEEYRVLHRELGPSGSLVGLLGRIWTPKTRLYAFIRDLEKEGASSSPSARGRGEGSHRSVISNDVETLRKRVGLARVNARKRMIARLHLMQAWAGHASEPERAAIEPSSDAAALSA